MKSLFSLNKYFVRYKWIFLLGILFVVLTNYFRILAPQVTGFVINHVVKSISHSENGNNLLNAEKDNYSSSDMLIVELFKNKNTEDVVWLSGLILLGLALISGLFMFLMRQTIIVMSRHIEYDQKNEIYEHYQRLDMSFHRRQTIGDLMNRISEDVSRVRMYTGPALMYFINLAAVIGFSVYFMLSSDVKLTLVALCPLPLLALIIYFVNSIINKKSEKIQSLLSTLTSNAQETYSGIRVIKSFVQEKSMMNHFNKNSESYRKSALGLAKTEALYFPSMGLLIGLSTLLTIMIGGMDVANGVEGASVGRIAEFVLYIQMLTFPVSAIGWTASMTQRASASQKRINDFLLIEPQIRNASGFVEFNAKGNIEIKDLEFTYQNTQIKAIDHLSININKGEKLVITGKTGCGKSTLAQLLLGIYQADSGHIIYNGNEIGSLRLEDLRLKIGFVPQEVFLFSDTIENNIKFGNQTATFDEVEQAAKYAGIYQEIVAFDNGFQTIVGERGVTLSGGQKQRISIARALIKKPDIIIFDDCFSAVDTKTEQYIFEQLNHYLHNRTAIIITHRVFSSLNMERVAVMDQGKIVEIGTPDQLAKQKGKYAEMLEKQHFEDNL
jgi:ATP-binding cassette subfamily B multidrug efflux pump